LRTTSVDPYPGCYVYYQFRQWVSAPTGNLVTTNFPVTTIQGVSATTAGHQAYFEWDAYEGLWREYGLFYPRPYPAYPNTVNWHADNTLYGNNTLSPSWQTVGSKGLVYDQPSSLPYAYEYSAGWGNTTAHGTFDVKKTCFAYQYQNTPQTPGGNFYYWYNKYYSVSISGQNRLAAFGTWLNGSGYYQYFQTNKQKFDPTANDSGSILIPVNNLTWSDTNGNTVTESFNYNLSWSTTQQSSGNVTISYTGYIPDGPSNADGTPNTGGNITGSGLLPVRTTAGVSNIYTIDPVFNLPSNVSATYYDAMDSSQLTIQPWPQHNLIKATFLGNATISGGNATYPIEIGDLAGRYGYAGVKGSGSKFVLSGFTRLRNLFWSVTASTVGTGPATRLYQEDYDYRIVNACLTSSANQSTSDANGTAYDLTLSFSYIHNSLYYQTYGTPVSTTNYVFKATTPKLANTLGANTTANFVQQAVSGAPYQNITLGTVEVEVIDI